ncbi:uncharacterized protein LOC110889317 isoform X3 [Helianthus annuus]|uniref:uncharacterized protein LOC110889317 isoform X3 n=1 Tax=Helianthus annuus TaxID=4232 RepID=UPI000B8F5311|nr:uncharacterized protein LOC110889317 isoform X3 [Helianthus annuus]
MRKRNQRRRRSAVSGGAAAAAMFGRRCLRFRVSVHSSLGSAISVQFVTVNSALVRFDKSTSVSIDLGQLRSQLKCGSRCCLVQPGSTRYNALWLVYFKFWR